MASTEPNSPSLPPPPIPLTPGPLAQRLAEVFNTALNHTLKTCNYANFSACFPTPAQKTPKVLNAVWTQIVGKIETKATTEFDQILKERRVVEGLNGLEGLVAEGKRRREGMRGEVVAPHTLPPEELFNAHLSPMLEPIQAQLEEQLATTRLRNTELAEGVRRQRDEIERIVGGLEAVIKDLEGANGVLEGVVDEQLREEVRDVAREVGAREGSRL